MDGERSILVVIVGLRSVILLTTTKGGNWREGRGIFQKTDGKEEEDAENGKRVSEK